MQFLIEIEYKVLHSLGVVENRILHRQFPASSPESAEQEAKRVTEELVKTYPIDVSSKKDEVNLQKLLEVNTVLFSMAPIWEAKKNIDPATQREPSKVLWK